MREETFFGKFIYYECNKRKRDVKSIIILTRKRIINNEGRMRQKFIT